jgi:hypothetical protein
MNSKLIPLALAALLAAGCNKEDHTIVQQDPADQGPPVAKLDPSQLPPSIKASKTYRCKDNSLLYIDWMSDQTARVKTDANGVGTPPAEGALTGTATDSTVTYNGKSCKA